ncbi:unnamed protein product [Paramecium sonneborni]|uniref:NOT2/NOT3/NOT5 C-terminal domain-containing protein n=1 Tax=Paramecium sonneborni TaxID=65129 RepID=A0A8S1R0U5_9CILI|nr:unnamed protein product [Paramecium sonneborni]
MEEEFKQKWGFAALQKYVSEREKDKDKPIYKLWHGMNLDELGVPVQENKFPGQPTKIISPFIDDNATQPDPLSKPHDWIKQKLMPRPNSVNRKKEMYSLFSEETNLYIFYNVMDEEQQLFAVENLYSKGWRYNLKKEQWFKEISLINKNLYSGKYFSIANWKIMESSQIDMQESDLCTIEQFFNNQNQ